MDLSHLENRQGDHGTHKLLLNPTQPSSSAVLLHSAAGSGFWGSGSSHWDGNSSSLPMTALLVSVAPGPAGQQMASDDEEAALPYPKSVSMSTWLVPSAYLLQNTGLVQIDHFGISKCLMLQFHSLGLQVSSVGRNKNRRIGGASEDGHIDSGKDSLGALQCTVLQ